MATFADMFNGRNYAADYTMLDNYNKAIQYTPLDYALNPDLVHPEDLPLPAQIHIASGSVFDVPLTTPTPTPITLKPVNQIMTYGMTITPTSTTPATVISTTTTTSLSTQDKNTIYIIAGGLILLFILR